MGGWGQGLEQSDGAAGRAARRDDMKSYRLLIGGDLVAGARTMDVVNPATEEPFAVAPRASEAQLEEAIAAAKTAFPAWAAKSMDERRDYLHALADAVDANVDRLARVLTMEQGKPLAEATAEITYTAYFIRELIKPELPVSILVDDDQKRVEVHRRPLGVVAAIIPWNFPALIVAIKLSLAAVAGNTVVIKPAPTTPLSALELGELAAGIFPPGVVNVISDANDLGALLAAHPDIAKVTFTGSTETGRKIMQGAAATIKRLTLELGGNDAAIVLGDVDPVEAAKGVFAAAFANAGQICLAIKRVYVHDRIYDAMCDELTRLANEAVVGDGLHQGTQIGPIQNSSQFEKLKGFLDDAHSSGNVVAGGTVLDGPGYFIRPTIVRDISDGSRLVDEEQFGPILPLIRFSDDEDALARANASPLGLGGSVWGADEDRAYALATRMEAGTVWVNQHLDFGPFAPFGGAKQSGIGTEFMEEGLHEFTQVHVINRKKVAVAE
jgi:acyl-CoA reductase-like NAD-dependent aldehyde dehydrogenase